MYIRSTRYLIFLSTPRAPGLSNRLFFSFRSALVDKSISHHCALHSVSPNALEVKTWKYSPCEPCRRNSLYTLLTEHDKKPGWSSSSRIRLHSFSWNRFCFYFFFFTLNVFSILRPKRRCKAIILFLIDCSFGVRWTCGFIGLWM